MKSNLSMSFKKCHCIEKDTNHGKYPFEGSLSPRGTLYIVWIFFWRHRSS